MCAYEIVSLFKLAGFLHVKTWIKLTKHGTQKYTFFKFSDSILDALKIWLFARVGLQFCIYKTFICMLDNLCSRLMEMPMWSLNTCVKCRWNFNTWCFSTVNLLQMAGTYIK